MKKEKFNVWFSSADSEPQCVTVYATERYTAKILAQAERIKQGLSFTVTSVKMQGT